MDYFPSPTDVGAAKALDGDKTVEVAPDAAAPFSALCFKVMVDPYVGKLSFIRVYSGTLSSEGNNTRRHSLKAAGQASKNKDTRQPGHPCLLKL